MSNYTTVDISLYFTNHKHSSKRIYKRLLSELCPRAIYRGKDFGPIKTLSEYPEITLTAGTVTIGNKRYLRMSWKEQMNELVLACKEFGNRRGVEYVAFSEATLSQVPHLHMLIYNGNKAQFIKAFSKFGSRNRHDQSFQPVRNLPGYIDYITKEYKGQETYFTNMHDHLFDNYKEMVITSTTVTME